MLLLDTTASMHLPTADDDPRPRKDTVRDALRLLVPTLAEQDDATNGKGLVTIAFADGKAVLLGDLNAGNFEARWASIVWEGNTRIMPAWRALCSHYIAEFGHLALDKRPIALVAILTDGEALDIADFGRALAPGSLPDDFFVAIGVLGSGADHDTALASFLPFVRAQRRLKVVRLHSQGGTPGGSGSYSNGHQIADALRDMFKNAQLTAAGWV